MEIFVNNLAYQVEDKDIRELFAAFGEVRRASVVKDRETGRSRGFGFVDMPNQAEGARAVAELNNQPLQGRNMMVSEARPRDARPAPSAGGFGGAPRPPRPAYTPSSSQPSGGYSSAAPRQPYGAPAPRQTYGAPPPRRPDPAFGNITSQEELDEIASRPRVKSFGPDRRKTDTSKFEEKKKPVLKGVEKGRQNNRLVSDDEDEDFTPPVRIR